MTHSPYALAPPDVSYNSPHLDQCREGIHLLMKKGSCHLHWFDHNTTDSINSWDWYCTNSLVPEDPDSTKASTTIPLWIQSYITFTDGLIFSVNHTQFRQVTWPEPVLGDNKDLRAFFYQRINVRQTGWKSVTVPACQFHVICGPWYRETLSCTTTAEKLLFSHLLAFLLMDNAAATSDSFMTS